MRFDYQNSGNAPALYFRFNNFFAEGGPSIDAAKISFPKTSNACAELERKKREGVIVLPSSTDFALSDDSKLSDAAFIDAVKSRRKTYFYIGCFLYEGVRGEKHHTIFCEYTHPDPN